MKTIKDIFTSKYDNNLWLGKESKSGPGSSLKNNIKLLESLKTIVVEYDIKNILDLGCGDFNWMKHFDFTTIDNYLGIDVVNYVIQSNRKKYGIDKIKFECHNIIDYDIKTFDLVLSKDVLVHLSYNDSLKILENIKKSKSKFFVSTSFENFKNYDIETGNWRPVNLITEPFNLGEPFLYYKNIEEKSEGWTTKGIGVWKL